MNVRLYYLGVGKSSEFILVKSGQGCESSDVRRASLCTQAGQRLDRRKGADGGQVMRQEKEYSNNKWWAARGPNRHSINIDLKKWRDQNDRFTADRAQRSTR